MPRPPGSPRHATDTRQDLKAFNSMFRLPAARIQIVTTLAGAASPWQATGAEIMDLEMVHTVAPAATLRVVLLPANVLESRAHATADMLAGLRLAVSRTDVASIGWNLGEHFFTRAQVAQMHSILRGAAAHHVTVVGSSGDNGAFSDTLRGTPVKEVSLPASDPLVLAAGGTTLTANPSPAPTSARPPGAEYSVAASATCTPVPPIRMASPGSGRPGACPTWPVTLMRKAAPRSSSPPVQASSRASAPAPPRHCGADSWRWPTSTPIAALASLTPPSTASPAAPATTKPSTTLLPVTTSAVGSVTAGYQAGPGWDPVTGWGTPNAQVLVPLLARSKT